MVEGFGEGIGIGNCWDALGGALLFDLGWYCLMLEPGRPLAAVCEGLLTSEGKEKDQDTQHRTPDGVPLTSLGLSRTLVEARFDPVFLLMDSGRRFFRHQMMCEELGRIAEREPWPCCISIAQHRF